MGLVVPPSTRAHAGRPPADERRTTADSLLREAEDLIRRTGPNVTLSDIAAAAGVTKPVVYHHIGNRDALGRRLADRLVDRMSTAIDAAVLSAGSPRDGLDRFLRAYLLAAWDDRHLFLYVCGGGDDRVAETLRLADRSVGPLAEAFADMRRDRDRDPAMATTWAYAVVGMLHFVTLSWIRDQRGDVESLTAHLGELLWSGLADPAA